MNTSASTKKLTHAEWALVETRYRILVQLHYARRAALVYPSQRIVANELTCVLVVLDSSLVSAHPQSQLHARVIDASNFQFRRLIKHRLRMAATKQLAAA